jgi:hypothetical protein
MTGTSQNGQKMDRDQAHKPLIKLAPHRTVFSISESRVNFFPCGVGHAIENKRCGASCCEMGNYGIMELSRSTAGFLLSSQIAAFLLILRDRDRLLERQGSGILIGDAMTASYRIPMSEKLREEILERDAFMCAYCDQWADSIDHIIPYSYCQNNDKDNLVACCMDCNLIANDKIFESLSAKRGYIRNKRGLHKWRMKFLNRYSHCIVCNDPYLEGHKKATHFICPRCRMHGLEWPKASKKK